MLTLYPRRAQAYALAHSYAREMGLSMWDATLLAVRASDGPALDLDRLTEDQQRRLLNVLRRQYVFAELAQWAIYRREEPMGSFREVMAESVGLDLGQMLAYVEEEEGEWEQLGALVAEREALTEDVCVEPHEAAEDPDAFRRAVPVAEWLGDVVLAEAWAGYTMQQLELLHHALQIERLEVLLGAV